MLLKGLDRAIVAPQTDAERVLKAIWEEVMTLSPISVEDDFFVDLGGHSLVAARVASAMRSRFPAAGVSVQDIYRHRTIRSLAAHIVDASAVSTGDGGAIEVDLGNAQTIERRQRRQGIAWKRWLCVSLQLVSLYVLYGLFSVPFLIGLFLTMDVVEGRMQLGEAIDAAVPWTFAAWPSMLLLSIVTKWLVIGRYRPGRYPLWSFYYFRWWLVTRIQAFVMSSVLAGTPLMSLYLRAMGARIGRNCTIDTPLTAVFDLLTVGDESCIGAETHMLGYRVEDGMLIIGRIDIGARCFVGIQSVLGVDVTLEDDARLDDLSLLPDGDRIEAGKAKRGSPAQLAELSLVEPPRGVLLPRPRPFLFGLLHLALIYVMGYLLIFTVLPDFALITYALMTGGPSWGVAAVYAVGPIGIVTFCMIMLAAKRLFVGKIKPGVYPLHSLAYLRVWFTDYLLTNCRTYLLPLHATLYLPPMLRLMGAKIGKRVEVSTISQITPDLLDIGDESFFADGCLVGGRRLFRGQVDLKPNKIGSRTFIGNSAFVPAGRNVGDECLIGVLSVPPPGTAPVPDATRWLGSPSFQLPRTEKVEGFNDDETYRPTRVMYAKRLTIELVRILLPGVVVASFMVALAAYLYWAYSALSVTALWLTTPLVFFALAVASALTVVPIKKILVGTFKPSVHPLWSMHVWLNEVVNGMFESIAAPVLEPMMGTPFVAMYMRRLGCKIGRDVFLETTLFSEFDLVEIGDGACLNLGSTIQTHLFEDRVMKAARLRIGKGCSVGNMAVILYDTEMEERSSLASLSLLMKGERLPAGTSWYGIPILPQKAAGAAARSGLPDAPRAGPAIVRFNKSGMMAARGAVALPWGYARDRDGQVRPTEWREQAVAYIRSCHMLGVAPQVITERLRRKGWGAISRRDFAAVIARPATGASERPYDVIRVRPERGQGPFGRHPHTRNDLAGGAGTGGGSRPTRRQGPRRY